MARGGARVWYFPDGYLPEKTTNSSLEAHEALMILNVGDRDAHIRMDIYFEDREPVMEVPITVPARRVISLHTDTPEQMGGVKIPPMTQYALRVTSDVPVVATFGRLDTTQANLAYYSPPCFWEEA